ncbi:MAG: glycine cleavage system protein GcvH [Desulfovibrionaceae bacterium]|nr:glycine cleavage system protein GcvH [Desulfovibrionaceae bacterium]
MTIPDHLLYRDSHEWARIEGKEAVIGITHYAQDRLGDVTYVDLPPVGAKLIAGKEFGSIESVKAAGDLYSPVSGSVIAVNEALEGAPEFVNKSPYDDGWMLRVKLTAEPAGLLKAADYAKCCT